MSALFLLRPSLWRGSGRFRARVLSLAGAAVLAAAAILPAGCVATTPAPLPREAGAHAVYLVSHGWHVGIAVRKEEVPAAAWPWQEHFADTVFLEVGWGHGEFYQARSPSIALTLKAALLPGPGVLHVAGFDEPVAAFFPDNTIVALRLDAAGFLALCRFIGESYATAADGGPVVLGEGLYGTSSFYLSGKDYTLCNNCNVWTATALERAGLPVSPFLNLTAEALMNRAASLGTVIRRTQH